MPAELFATVDVAAARSLAGPERRRVAKWLEEAGVTSDGVAWLHALEDELGDLSDIEVESRVVRLPDGTLVRVLEI